MLFSAGQMCPRDKSVILPVDNTIQQVNILTIIAFAIVLLINKSFAGGVGPWDNEFAL